MDWRLSMKLTNAKIKKLPLGKKYSDGGGLYLFLKQVAFFLLLFCGANTSAGLPDYYISMISMMYNCK